MALFLFTLVATRAEDTLVLKENSARIPGRVLEVFDNSVLFLENGTKEPVKHYHFKTRQLILERNQGQTGTFDAVKLYERLNKWNPSDFVWCGLDFSKVKIVHSAGFQKYTPALFKSMNLFVADKKGEFASLWDTTSGKRFSNITKIDDDAADLANSNTDVALAFENTDQFRLPLDTIRQILRSYDFPQYPDGIGIILFYSMINKSTESVRVYFVLFDIRSRDILWVVCQNLKGTGITMEWHWTQGLQYIFRQLRNYANGEYYDLFRIFSPWSQN